MAQLQFPKVGGAEEHFAVLDYDGRKHRTVNEALSAIIGTGPNLSKLHISSPRLTQVGPTVCDNGHFRNTVWSGLAFKGCIFIHCDFSWARFASVVFDECLFIDCRLEGIDFDSHCRWLDGSAFIKCPDALFVSTADNADVLRFMNEGRPIAAYDFRLRPSGISKHHLTADERDASASSALWLPSVNRIRLGGDQHGHENQ